MAKYFEALNNVNKIIIDDTYRYLYEVGTIQLQNSAQAPIMCTWNTHDSDTFGSKIKWNILRFQATEKWMYLQGGPFLSRSAYSRYMCYVKQINPNRLYGIRFKKASGSPKVLVRMSPTVLGAAISNNANVHSIFVEVITNDTRSIGGVNGYQDYFEIVEIANDRDCIPYCKSGAEIYNEKGEVIWNSNCKLKDVVYYYSGNIAGSFKCDFSTSNIVVPNKTYKKSLLWDSDGGFTSHSSQERDFYMFNGSELINEMVSIIGDRMHKPGTTGALWDYRDFGSDPSNNISGLILR